MPGVKISSKISSICVQVCVRIFKCVVVLATYLKNDPFRAIYKYSRLQPPGHRTSLAQCSRVGKSLAHTPVKRRRSSITMDARHKHQRCKPRDAEKERSHARLALQLQLQWKSGKNAYSADISGPSSVHVVLATVLYIYIYGYRIL